MCIWIFEVKFGQEILTWKALEMQAYESPENAWDGLERKNIKRRNPKRIPVENNNI